MMVDSDWERSVGLSGEYCMLWYDCGMWTGLLMCDEMQMPTNLVGPSSEDSAAGLKYSTCSCAHLATCARH